MPSNPINLADETGRPLDGASKHTIHFEKTALPPVDAFWSVTLYDQEGFQVANPLNALPSAGGCRSSMIRTVRSPSISKTTIRVRTRRPTGCLPEGRLQSDHASLCAEVEALTGKWNPPPVTRLQVPSLSAQ